MSQKIKLAEPTKRFNHNGELFLATEIYIVNDERAQYLLDQTDPSTGFPYFEQYTGSEAGVTPEQAREDEVQKAPRRERPRVNMRKAQPERGPVDRSAIRAAGAARAASSARAGVAKANPIEEDTGDATTV